MARMISNLDEHAAVSPSNGHRQDVVVALDNGHKDGTECLRVVAADKCGTVDRQGLTNRRAAVNDGCAPVRNNTQHHRQKQYACQHGAETENDSHSCREVYHCVDPLCESELSSIDSSESSDPSSSICRLARSSSQESRIGRGSKTCHAGSCATRLATNMLPRTAQRT